MSEANCTASDGSAFRFGETAKLIEKVCPWWKRPFVCFRNFNLWRKARVMDRLFLECEEMGYAALADSLARHSAELWMRIYRFRKCTECNGSGWAGKTSSAFPCRDCSGKGYLPNA